MTIDGDTSSATEDGPPPRSMGDTLDLLETRSKAGNSVGSEVGQAPATPHHTSESVTDEPARQITDAVWRYHLDVIVGDSAGSQSWQATDPVLGRKVGVRLLPASDERAEDLRDAACLAARVSDRRLIHVLDVVDVKFEGSPHIAIVTEWVEGRPLQELIHDPMSAVDSLRLAAEVAECLETAHLSGIAHGRLRPHSLLITAGGEVRVRGLGVDAVLKGCDPDPDPVLADIRGIGGILYACVSGRWPYGDVDGVAAAPEIGGGVPLPSRVAPAVTGPVDLICSRSVGGTTPPREGGTYSRVAPLAADLRLAAGPGREAPATKGARRRRSHRVGRRLTASVIGLVAVGALGLLGWQLVADGPSAVSPRPVITASTAPRPTATVPPPVIDQALPIIRVSDFDPLGNGRENSDLAPLAIDGKPATAWTTVVYASDYLSGKPGVGLLLDLGAPRPVSAVKLTLVGPGTDLEIRTSEKVSDDPAAYTPFAAATAAPEDIVLRAPKPVTARYVLIWITRVSSNPDSGYQGGIGELTVLG